MKTTNKTVIAAVASVALFAVTSSAQAQYKPTGDDGIAASPKVRYQLNDRNAGINIGPAVVPAMACPMCKDVWVILPDRHAKGAQVLVSGGVPTQTIARHLCAGCETTVTTEGLSKQTRHDVVTHKCTGCGAEILSCCRAKNGSRVATKGMEKF